MSDRATREDVARAAGVSVATVSMALRGLARVPEGTRKRVREAAEKLGYRPNAAAAALASRRAGGAREGASRVVLLSETPFLHSEVEPVFQAFGFDLAWRQPSEFAGPKAASRQLWSEGFSGVVANPNAWSWDPVETMSFEWERFSVVKFTRGLPQLRVHAVRHSAFDYADEAIARVVAAGYREIVVRLPESVAERDDRARMGAILNWRREGRSRGVRLRLLGHQPDDWDGLCEQLRRRKPEVYVAMHWSDIYGLEERGMEVPGEMAMAAILTAREDGRVAGCEKGSGEVARRLATILRALIGRGERGMSQSPLEQVVQPVWVEGSSLPVLPRCRE